LYRYFGLLRGGLPLLLDKTVARMAIVVDAVLQFEFLNVVESSFGMQAGNAVAKRLARVKEYLFEATIHGHTLMVGQILEQRGETFLQTHGNIHALNLESRARVEQVMSEHEVVPVQIPDCIVAQSPGPVPRRLDDFDAVGALELVQFVGVAHDEIHRAPFGIGRALLQEYLHATQIHTRHRRRVAPGEGLFEAELFRVELGGCEDVADRQAGVMLLAVNLGVDELVESMVGLVMHLLI